MPLGPDRVGSGRDRLDDVAEERKVPQRLLQSWLGRQLPEAALGWLEEQRARLEGEPFLARDLYVAIGLVPRKLGKAPLLLEEADLVAAAEGSESVEEG